MKPIYLRSNKVKYCFSMFCVLNSSLMMSCSSAQYARTAAPQEPIVESLFAEKDRTISEENIQKLLDGKLTLPTTLRVALYRHGDSRQTRQRILSKPQLSGECGMWISECTPIYIGVHSEIHIPHSKI